MNPNLNRRTFLKSTVALSTLGAWPGFGTGALGATLAPNPSSRKLGIVRGAFFYPPAQVVLDGKCEDSWNVHQ